MTEKRFVVLEHHWNGVHYDFMIEAGSILRTWKLDVPPRAGERLLIAPSFDHRLHYLDYEGPISGNRGYVVRWDSGVYREERFDAGELRLNLQGSRLRGNLLLKLLGNGQWEWQFTVQFAERGRSPAG